MNLPSTQNGTPTVSVIMPARDEEQYIGEAIDSLRSQSLKDWELLVIDDGSTDRTAEIVRSYQEVDGRIRLLDGGGRGVSHARNRGLEAARGRLITFLDADDVYYEGALEKRARMLDAYPICPVVYCPCEMTDEELNPLGWTLGSSVRVITFDNMHINPNPINAVMGRAEIFKQFTFPEGYGNGEDWLFHSRLMRSGYNYFPMPDCRVAYRLHRQSTVMAGFIQHQEALMQILDIIYGEDPGCENPLPPFRHGLQDPPLQAARLKRLMQNLTVGLLQGEQDLEPIVTTLEAYDWSLVSRAHILSSIQYTVMRLHVCHQDQWEEVLLTYKPAIVETFKKHQVKRRLRPYHAVMSRLIGIGNPEIQPERTLEEVLAPKPGGDAPAQ